MFDHGAEGIVASFEADVAAYPLETATRSALLYKRHVPSAASKRIAKLRTAINTIRIEQVLGQGLSHHLQWSQVDQDNLSLQPAGTDLETLIELEIDTFGQRLDDFYDMPQNQAIIAAEQARLQQIIDTYKTQQEQLLVALTRYLTNNRLTKAQSKLLDFGLLSTETNLYYQGQQYDSVAEKRIAVANYIKKQLLTLDETITAQFDEAATLPNSDIFSNEIVVGRQIQRVLNGFAQRILDESKVTPIQTNNLNDTIEHHRDLSGALTQANPQTRIAALTEHYRDYLAEHEGELANGTNEFSFIRNDFLREISNEQIAARQTTIKQLEERTTALTTTKPLEQLKQILRELEHEFPGTTLLEKLRDSIRCQNFIRQNSAHPDIRRLQTELAQANPVTQTLQQIIDSKSLSERIQERANPNQQANNQEIIKKNGYCVVISRNQNKVQFKIFDTSNNYHNIFNKFSDDRYLDLALLVINSLRKFDASISASNPIVLTANTDPAIRKAQIALAAAFEACHIPHKITPPTDHKEAELYSYVLIKVREILEKEQVNVTTPARNLS